MARDHDPPTTYEDEKPGETRWANPTIVAPLADYDTEIRPAPDLEAVVEITSSSWGDVQAQPGAAGIALVVSVTSLVVMAVTCGVVLWVTTSY